MRMKCGRCRLLFLPFLASIVVGQSVETAKGVRLVHNGKEGAWGKRPKVQVELVRTLGDVAAENEAVAFYMPGGMAVDSAGNLYILDTGNHRVQKFDPDGKYLASFGRQGQGPGDFSYPDSIAIDGQDMIWVSDPNNQRIQVLTPEGAERKTIGFVKDRVGKIGLAKSGVVMAGGEESSSPTREWKRGSTLFPSCTRNSTWMARSRGNTVSRLTSGTRCSISLGTR